MLIINVILAFVFLGIVAVANIYDIRLTVKGIKAGVALENFTWLVGDRPTAKALYLRDLIFFVPLAIFTILVIGCADSYATTPFLLFPTLFALKHLQGALKWRYVLAGGVLDIEGFPVVNGVRKLHNAFQLFIGPWIWHLPAKK